MKRAILEVSIESVHNLLKLPASIRVDDARISFRRNAIEFRVRRDDLPDSCRVAEGCAIPRVHAAMTGQIGGPMEFSGWWTF